MKKIEIFIGKTRSGKTERILNILSEINRKDDEIIIVSAVSHNAQYQKVLPHVTFINFDIRNTKENINKLCLKYDFTKTNILVLDEASVLSLSTIKFLIEHENIDCIYLTYQEEIYVEKIVKLYPEAIVHHLKIINRTM